MSKTYDMSQKRDINEVSHACHKVPVAQWLECPISNSDGPLLPGAQNFFLFFGMIQFSFFPYDYYV